ncbi:unnamed protein product [Leptidea sinapis]|uniref:Uncharacterized protein n=1 Tax=Leptidea sinapis TaxID=189913 RepID=A0A5E4QCI9_9NEOP|nr:unnamed protein product [Leptidea sinapis]
MEVNPAETSELLISNIDPASFDVTVGALLIGVGIDDIDIRKKLIDEVKNLPIYQEQSNNLCNTEPNLGPLEIIQVLEESSQHLYRLHLSMMANNISLKKSKRVTDCLIHQDIYASDVCLCTLSHMNNLLNSMELALHTKFKSLSSKSSERRNKKILAGAFGTIAVGVLSVLFIRSLKHM